MRIFSNRTGGFIPALILAVMLVIGVTAQKTNAQYGNGQYGDDQYGNYGDMSYQNFYDDLAPYGQWMNDPQYGYVWAPNVGNDFRPYYSNGYWMMTDYGNMWMSNYSWGWAPFHYGRWTLSNYYGWIWIPGNEWGPAWVSWRQGGGNYGWAPMGPGVNINISFGSGYNVPNPWWTFIPCGNIYSRNFHRYYSPRQTVNIINNTTIINNTYVDARARTTYVTGPRRTDVERATRQKVNVYNVSNRSRAGNASISGRTVSVYRPSVRESSGRGQQSAAPRQFKALDRSVVNNSGTGTRQSGTNNGQRIQQDNNNNRSAQPQNPRPGSNTRSVRDVQQNNGSRQTQPTNETRQRNIDQQRSQQETQRNLQLQQAQEQQRNQQLQRSQQQETQRNQQLQQQRMQQQQDQQRNQQIQQQQRMQETQRNQQIQQQRSQQIQQQRSQQAQPQRSIQQAQPQRVERSAPVQRSAPAAERSTRGR